MINLSRMAVLAGALCVGTATVARSQHAAQQSSHPLRVAGQTVLGGDGGWDYLSLDTATNRLFVTRTDRVMVVDLATDSVVGEIPGLNRGHGVAFAYAQHHGFVSSGRDSTVTMFDLRTLRPLARTVAADDDDGILFDHASGRVFTFNGDAHSATALDAATGARIASVDLGGKPEFGVSDDAGRLYVNIESTSEIVEVDSRALKVLRRWSIQPCEGPSGLAIDRAHHRLFSVCDHVMAISDAVAGTVVDTAAIGDGPDAARYDAATGEAYASNGDGSITVVKETSPGTWSAVETVQTMRGARTMELDPRTHTIYTVSARFGQPPAAATPDNPRRRPPIVPNSFTLLTIKR